MTWTQTLARRGVSSETQILAAPGDPVPRHHRRGRGRAGHDAVHQPDGPAAARQHPAEPASPPGVRAVPPGPVDHRAEPAGGPDTTHVRRGRHPGADVPDRAGRVAAALAAGRRRRRRGVDVRRPARPDQPPDRAREPAARVVRRVRARVRGRHGVRRRLLRRRATDRPAPRGGPGRRVRQGGAGRRPGAAALGRLRRAARRAAAAAVPHGRQRLPDPPGVGRGVRHRHPPLRGPAHR